MIISCPACATRYVVPDTAVGPEGRTVRCAKCRHSWFQDGPELVEPIAAAYAAPAPTAAAAPAPRDQSAAPAGASTATGATEANVETPQESAPPATDEDTIASVHGEAAAGNDAADAPSVGPTGDGEAPPPLSWTAPDQPRETGPDFDEVSQFDHEPPFRPRRNWLRLLTWGAGAFAVLALAAIAAVSALGLPSWLPIDKPLFGADPGLKVEFPASEQERRTLPNGAEFFGARVVVTNETRETKTVPPLLIVLRDAREKIVYSWELVPPQRTLAPGEAQTINEAMTDVPKSAVYADIGWAPR